MAAESKRLIKGDRLIEVPLHWPRRRERRTEKMNRPPRRRRVTTDGSSIALYAIWGLSDSNFCGKSDYEDFSPPRAACPTAGFLLKKYIIA